MPKQLFRFDDSLHASRATFLLVFYGSLFVAVLIFLQLLYSVLILNNVYVIPRVGLALFIIIYLICVHFVSRKSRSTAGWMLVLLYLLVGLAILVFWGINAPIGILTLGFVIFLTNIILGSKHILLMVCFLAIGLSLVQLNVLVGIYTPDLSSFSETSTFADVFTYLIIFSIFAIASWLSGFQNEQSLTRALRAERALLKEKRSLSKKLDKQALILRNAQLEEMRQLYKFAELGQLTSSLFHELANHLSVLHLDVKEISTTKQKTSSHKIEESIAMIDKMVKEVRQRIVHENQSEIIELKNCIQSLIDKLALRDKQGRYHTRIHLDTHSVPDPITIKGDSTRLIQALSILINNALHACAEKECPPITIKLSRRVSTVQISVIDFGVGIPASARDRLFRPQQSTKKNGLGIGLYIARQFIETHFNGKIFLDTKHLGTCFIIELPIH